MNPSRILADQMVAQRTPAQPAVEPAAQPPHPFRFNREAFARLAESGALGERPRVELIFGEIVQMSPQNRRHANAVARLTKLLSGAVGPAYAVRVQLPLGIADDQEPEPDLCVSPWPADLDADHPATAPLVVEVADSSLAYDRETKVRVYALAGVLEFWIVDVNGKVVEVHTEPAGDRYANKRTARPGDAIAATAVAGLVVQVGEIFGS